MTTSDYTSRDYFSIKTDLLARAEQVLPEWTSRDSSDFGMLLVDLWAYMGDILHYYIDRAAQESFLETATQRESILAIANLLDYTPAGRAAASTNITLNATDSAATDATPILIPKYTRFVAKPLLDTADDVIFTSDTAIAFNSTGAAISGYATYQKTEPVNLNLTEGELFEESFTSDGRVSQQYTLSYTGVIDSSVEVYIAEGTNGAEVTYSKVDRLIEATNSDLVFAVSLAADDSSTIVFGNSVHGKIPTTNALVRIVYRRSRGAAGNVDVNAVQGFESLNNIYGPTYDGIEITPNTTKAFGGSDSESIASLQNNIPASFRSQDRAVSLNDYSDLTLRVPSVVKATAVITNDVAASDGVESFSVTSNVVTIATSTASPVVVPSEVVRIAGLGYPYDGSFVVQTTDTNEITYDLDIEIDDVSLTLTDSNFAKYYNGNVQIFALPDQATYDGTLDVSPTTSPLNVESDIRVAIYDYIAPRQMVGVNTVVSPYVNLNTVSVDITLNVMSTYVKESVQNDVESAIKDLFSFSNVTFGQVVTLGTLYRTILDVSGVDYVTISQFTTTGNPDTIDTVGISPSVKGVKAFDSQLLLLSQLVIDSSGGIVTA